MGEFIGTADTLPQPDREVHLVGDSLLGPEGGEVLRQDTTPLWSRALDKQGRIEETEQTSDPVPVPRVRYIQSYTNTLWHHLAGHVSASQ